MRKYIALEVLVVLMIALVAVTLYENYQNNKMGEWSYKEYRPLVDQFNEYMKQGDQRAIGLLETLLLNEETSGYPDCTQVGLTAFECIMVRSDALDFKGIVKEIQETRSKDLSTKASSTMRISVARKCVKWLRQEAGLGNIVVQQPGVMVYIVAGTNSNPPIQTNSEGVIAP
jgi:hypothetical protein